ncbi:unnamed protein product [Schistocephalus solidus]|uniref:P53 domain-containing protein n=1 Tax=Schistocephalus solidus TaxID=70667 RepID=A0A183STT5_SCHSO|nr:unnamed protein product [Schistocephalus solidus]
MSPLPGGIMLMDCQRGDPTVEWSIQGLEGPVPTSSNSIPLGFSAFGSMPFVRDMNEQDSTSDGDVLMNCQNSLKLSPSPHQEFDSPGLKAGRPDSVTCAQLPPKKLYTDDIPVLDPFPGYYGFDFYHPLCEDAYEATETKPSTAYFYFKDDQGWTNLYAKKAPTWWTLSYWCQRQPPEGCFIRLVPVYGTSDKQQEVIQRCLEDFMASPTPGTARYSMILVGNSLAEYFYDLSTERLCVSLPYERPKVEKEERGPCALIYSLQVHLQMAWFSLFIAKKMGGEEEFEFAILPLSGPMCCGSPMHGPCEVLGRQCLKFRSCACPKRDKDNNERRIAQDMVESGLNGSGQIPNSKRRREGASRGKGFNDSCNDRVSPTYSTKLPVYRDQLSGLKVDSEFAMVDDIRSAGSLTFDDRQNLIQLNGETFHVILMPAYLPGGASTLRQMRSALLKTFYAAKDLQSATGGFLSRDSHDQEPKLISDESCFVIENKQSSIYEDSFIQFIQNVEGKAASLM